MTIIIKIREPDGKRLPIGPRAPKLIPVAVIGSNIVPTADHLHDKDLGAVVVVEIGNRVIEVFGVSRRIDLLLYREVGAVQDKYFLVVVMGGDHFRNTVAIQVANGHPTVRKSGLVAGSCTELHSKQKRTGGRCLTQFVLPYIKVIAGRLICTISVKTIDKPVTIIVHTIATVCFLCDGCIRQPQKKG